MLKTNHTKPVVDVAVNDTGGLLCTAGEDGKLCVYKCNNNFQRTSEFTQQTSDKREIVQTLGWTLMAVIGEGVYNGAVSCVAWAPSVFYYGCLIACSISDNYIRMWSDVNETGFEAQYQQIYTSTLPSPGLCAAWGPHQFGKIFAVGCIDGSVVVYTGVDNQSWSVHRFVAYYLHPCKSLSFAPFFPPGALLITPLQSDLANKVQSAPSLHILPPRIVTCGGSDEVKVWTHSFVNIMSNSNDNNDDANRANDRHTTQIWSQYVLLAQSNKIWSCSAWAPNVGLPFTYIAIGGDKGEVVVCRQDGTGSSQWQVVQLPTQPAPITKLSWSDAGTFLLISTANGLASMWMETPSGDWDVVTQLHNPKMQSRK